MGWPSCSCNATNESAGVLENAVHLNPSMPKLHHKLGHSYFALGRIASARAEFEFVAQLAPRESNAHYQLTRLYARLGGSPKAQEMAAETRRLEKLQLEQDLAQQTTRLERFQPVEAP